MATIVLSKEEFVSMVIEAQDERKRLGVKLQKISDDDFNELLTNVFLEFGEVKKKVTKKAQQVKKKVTDTIEDVTIKAEKIKEEVIVKVESVKLEINTEIKEEEPVLKLKEIRGKHGFMQLAFDF